MTLHTEQPTIEEVKALQARLDLLDTHIVWLGADGFVMAHTDEERERLDDLTECPLHWWLYGLGSAPREPHFYYRVTRHRPDGYSESYRGDAGPWDFERLDVPA